MNRLRTVLFAGGGTGGHLFPGLALAADLQAMAPGITVLFATASRALDRDIVARAGFVPARIGIRGWTTGIFKYPLMGLSLAYSLAAALVFVLKRRVDAVIGLGGYASFAPVIAGWILRRRVFILEQNTIPGRANRFTSRFATAVVTQFAGTSRYLPGRNVLHLGNPVRREIVALRNMPRPAGFTLAVIGGSQGAQRLNEIFIEAAAMIAFPVNSRIVHLCGAAHEAHCRELYDCAAVKAEVDLAGFRADMASVYRETSLAVCRSGATSLAELTCAGIPLVMVPFPFATDDHQYFNAQEIEAGGGGICIRQEDLTAAKLAEIVNGLLADRGRLDTMRQASAALGQPGAGPAAAAVILEGAGACN